MKKLFLLTFLTPLMSSAFSQISKGDFLVGGSAGFSSYKSSGKDASNVKGTNFTFSPDAGYFVFNKAAAGLRLSLNSIKSDVSGSGISTTLTSTTISPFVRYYFLKEKNKVNIFADGSYDYSTQKGKYGSSSSTSTTNGFTVAAGPSVFLNPHVALEFTVGYLYSKSKDYDQKVSTFQTSVGFQVHLGKNKKVAEK